ALLLLENGLKTVGENALLYAAMGHAYFHYLHYAFKLDESYLQKAEQMARKALDLDPDSARGYVLAAQIHYKKHNVQQAVRDLKRALAVDPNDSDALYYLTWFYMISGKGSAARPLAKKLREIDPLTPINHSWPGWVELFEGQFEAAVEPHRRRYEMDKENP